MHASGLVIGCGADASVSGRPLLVLGPSAEWGWERRMRWNWNQILLSILVPIEIQLTRGEEGVRFSD